MSSSVRQAVSVNITPPATTSASRETAAPADMRMTVSKVNFWYGSKQTLFDINLGFATNKVTALIGPSGCGKSTLLRTLDRMHETVRHSRLEGEILLDGKNILSQDVTLLRRRVGMVFQRPNPFPKSIFENVAYGLRINGSKAPHGRSRRKEPTPRRPLGRSQGPPAQVRLRAFRRPAAASLHRSRPRRRT